MMRLEGYPGGIPGLLRFEPLGGIPGVGGGKSSLFRFPPAGALSQGPGPPARRSSWGPAQRCLSRPCPASYCLSGQDSGPLPFPLLLHVAHAKFFRNSTDLCSKSNCIAIGIIPSPLIASCCHWIKSASTPYSRPSSTMVYSSTHDLKPCVPQGPGHRSIKRAVWVRAVDMASLHSTVINAFPSGWPLITSLSPPGIS